MRDRLASLDGLRALSVVLVFFAGYHWLMPFGWVGVLVFYVLSGYLITNILLGEKEHAAGAPRAFFGRFY
jgi:peptidoglycan/LPS O-acetylase OafA/YrhL